jgi:hypothetical protein
VSLCKNTSARQNVSSSGTLRYLKKLYQVIKKTEGTQPEEETFWRALVFLQRDTFVEELEKEVGLDNRFCKGWIDLETDLDNQRPDVIIKPRSSMLSWLDRDQGYEFLSQYGV